MNEIIDALSNHAEKFQAHANTAKDNNASQVDKENAFFNAQIHWAGIQHKFQEISHHVGLEFIDIMKGFGMDWFKENMKPNENPDAVKAETAATPETSEPVQQAPQPQFLGDVPQQAVQETTPTTEATPTAQEQEAQQITS